MGAIHSARRLYLLEVEDRARRKCLATGKGKRRKLHLRISGNESNGTVGGSEIDPRNAQWTLVSKSLPLFSDAECRKRHRTPISMRGNYVCLLSRVPLESQTPPVA